jgi:hypothetical protein
MISLSIIITFLTNFFIKLTKLSIVTTKFVIYEWMKQEKDYNQMTIVYNEVYILDSFLLILITLRLLPYFKLEQNMRLTYEHLLDLLSILFKTIITILIIILLFSIIFCKKLGVKFYEFKGFYSSFVRTLMFTVGKIFYFKQFSLNRIY